MIHIDLANAAEHEVIAMLLEASELPAESLERAQFLVARDGELVAGCVGLERHGDSVLLRSLAVAPAHRGKGVGRQLVDAVVDRARTQSAAEVVVLTNTAVEMFRSMGFIPTRRADLGSELLGSWQFQAPVCSEASCLRRALN